LWNSTGWWLHWDIGCWRHDIFSEEDEDCTWYEGWAEFLPLRVNGDQCYDWGLGPCNGSYEDIETHNLYDAPNIDNFGEAVEGRVAGALYDLVDYNNEIYDKTSFDFSLIAYLLVSSPLEESFSDFWESWLNNGFDHFEELVSSFYLNTIGGGFIFIPMVVK